MNYKKLKCDFINFNGHEWLKIVKIMYFLIFRCIYLKQADSVKLIFDGVTNISQNENW